MDVKWHALKMAISKFQNFEFLTSKISKNQYFWENLIKSFFNLKKRIICHRTSCLLSSCQISKEIDLYSVPQSSKNLQKLRMPKFLITFLEVFDNWHRWKWYRWTRIGKLNRTEPILVQTTNLTICPDLTWPWPDLDLKATLSDPDY